MGYPVIISAVPGGPANKAGLGAGDIVESIDGITTREMNLVQIHQLLSGPMNKPASLSVIRSRRADPETVSVPREVFQAPPVEAKLLESSIAYIKIPYLGSGKTAEARKQLDGLLKRGASSVILDLRYTAGGDDKEGFELANLFISSGILGSIKGQKGPAETFGADPKLALTKAPLAVLVNQGTAGAAEITAGAIADNSRGQLVGLKTFGMGSVQKLIPVEDGFGLLISTAKYYRPSGKEIQQAEPQDSGIKPSIEIRQASEEVVDPRAEDLLDDPQPPANQPTPNDEDRQLNKALEILKDPSQVSATKKAA